MTDFHNWCGIVLGVSHQNEVPLSPTGGITGASRIA